MQERNSGGESDGAGDGATRADGGTRRATAAPGGPGSLLPSGVVSGHRERAEEPPAERCMSKDEVFEMLQNERRRRILRYLLEADDVMTIGELAERIAAVENDTSVAALNSTQRKRVYVALYQTHLPKMDDVGVIDYDRDRGRVQVAENADLLTYYLDEEFDDDDPWHRRYLLLSVLGGALVVVGHLLGGAAGPALGLLVVALFLSVSVAHGYSYWRERTGTEATRRRIE
jgi:DNA-binding transcriptional ArsR family regulator